MSALRNRSGSRQTSACFRWRQAVGTSASSAASALRDCGLLILLLSLTVGEPVRAADDKIDPAVKKGAEYLDAQFGKGVVATGNQHGTGGVALAGMALLEAGNKADSPGLSNIIKGMNAEALALTQTYEVALAILFYDKLADKTGDKSYEGIIQVLGVRLYAGMTASGGWGYSTWDIVNAQELVRLAESLKKTDLVAKPGEKPADPPVPKKDDGFLKPGAAPAPAALANRKLHPEASRQLLNVQQVLRARGRGNVLVDDNSNTQFGLIGLWVAARHGLPANDAFALIEARFLNSQSRQDAGWTYTNILGIAGSSSPAMTCAGLLGLAVGAGTRNALIADSVKEKPAEPAKPGGDDPFANPKLKPVKAAPVLGPGKAAEAALSALGKFLGGTRPNAPGIGRGNFPAGRGDLPGAGGLGGLQNFVGGGNSYYLLWSVERVAMAYGLDTIGDVDWYEWGSNYLLPAQLADGSWTDSTYGSVVNTSFAMLFLTKSNSVRDLSNKIKGKVRDPGKTELRAGSGATPALFAPAPKAGSKPEPKIDPKTAGPAFTLPAVVAPSEQAEIVKVSTELATATEAAWKAKLDEARDAKGSKWTRGLVAVCNGLEAEKKQQARDALAERLTRMTSKTLREMLADPEPELRRAACLAAGMKEDKLLIPALIERITDPADSVVRAAKASLKSISQADFGPPSGADDEAKLKAAATWRSWFEALPK